MLDGPLNLSPLRSTLALDVATRTGWAFATGQTILLWPSTHMEAGQPVPRQMMKAVKSGSMKFGGETSVVIPEFRRWLTDKIAAYSPSIIAVEKPKPITGGKKRKVRQPDGSFKLVESKQINLMTLVRLHAMYAAVLEVARIQGVQVCDYHLVTIKHKFTGHGAASKPDMVAESVRRGLTPKNDDEADAQAILNLHALVANMHVVLRGEDA